MNCNVDFEEYKKVSINSAKLEIEQEEKNLEVVKETFIEPLGRKYCDIFRSLTHRLGRVKKSVTDMAEADTIYKFRGKHDVYKARMNELKLSRDQLKELFEIAIQKAVFDKMLQNDLGEEDAVIACGLQVLYQKDEKWVSGPNGVKIYQIQ